MIRDLEWKMSSEVMNDSDSDDFDTDSDTATELVPSGWDARKRTVRVAGVIGLFALACVLVVVKPGSERRVTTAGRASVGSKVSLVASEDSAVVPDEPGTNVDQALIPKQDTTDNNPCNDDEETHLGLCYMKCSTLTQYRYPFRQSAWTCCNEATCGISNLFGCCKHNMGFCDGFDIAGMKEGNKICPHKYGACLTNEELFLGQCYKTCTLLSNGVYPYRVASETCCKVRDGTCIIPSGVQDGLDGQSNTSAAYDVGGGCDDVSNFTHCQHHAPQQALTD